MPLIVNFIVVSILNFMILFRNSNLVPGKFSEHRSLNSTFADQILIVLRSTIKSVFIKILIKVVLTYVEIVHGIFWIINNVSFHIIMFKLIVSQ